MIVVFAASLAALLFAGVLVVDHRRRIRLDLESLARWTSHGVAVVPPDREAPSPATQPSVEIGSASDHSSERRNPDLAGGRSLDPGKKSSEASLTESGQGLHSIEPIAASSGAVPERKGSAGWDFVRAGLRPEFGSDQFFDGLPELHKFESALEWPKPDVSAMLFLAADPVDQAGSIVRISHCRGVLVGEHGSQANRFEYRVEEPIISMKALLSRGEVVEALQVLALAPRDPAVVADAEAALGRGRLFFSREWLVPYSSEATVQRCSAAVQGAADRVVLVLDSEGVSVGDYVHQESDFQYTVKPEIDAIDLFADSAELVRLSVAAIANPSRDSASVVDRVLAEHIRVGVMEIAADAKNRGIHLDAPKRREEVSAFGVDGLIVANDYSLSNDIEVAGELFGRSKEMLYGLESVPTHKTKTSIQRLEYGEDGLEDVSRRRHDHVTRESGLGSIGSIGSMGEAPRPSDPGAFGGFGGM